jgi:hypothetical protein
MQLIELSFNCCVFTQWLAVLPGGKLWSEQTTVEGVKIQYLTALYCGSTGELVGKNRPE